MFLMFWFIQICSLCFGSYKYVPYVLVHTNMFLMFWCIQICSLCFGSYKYVPYVLVHTNEPAHDKTYKMACALLEDSDQPGHPPSLISLHCALNG